MSWQGPREISNRIVVELFSSAQNSYFTNLKILHIFLWKKNQHQSQLIEFKWG